MPDLRMIVPYLAPGLVSLLGLVVLVRGELGPSLSWLPVPAKRLRRPWARLAGVLLLSALPLLVVAEWVEISWLDFQPSTERAQKAAALDALLDRPLAALGDTTVIVEKAIAGMEQLLKLNSDLRAANPGLQPDAEEVQAQQTLAKMRQTLAQRLAHKRSLEETRDQTRRERTAAWAKLDNQVKLNAGFYIVMACLVAVSALVWVVGEPMATAPASQLPPMAGAGER